MSKDIEECKRAAQMLTDIAVKNEKLLEEHKVKLAAYNERYGAHQQRENRRLRRSDEFSKYPANAIDDFEVGCDHNHDGLGRCRAEARNRGYLDQFWHVRWDNCAHCGCSWKAGCLCGRKKFGCYMDHGASEREWATLRQEFTEREPKYEPMPLQANVVCQHCQNVMNALGNKDSKVVSSQMANCIANIQTAPPPAPPSAPPPAPPPAPSVSNTSAPSLTPSSTPSATPTEEESKKKKMIMLGGGVCICLLCFFLLLMVLML